MLLQSVDLQEEKCFDFGVYIHVCVCFVESEQKINTLFTR